MTDEQLPSQWQRAVDPLKIDLFAWSDEIHDIVNMRLEWVPHSYDLDGGSPDWMIEIVQFLYSHEGNGVFTSAIEAVLALDYGSPSPAAASDALAAAGWPAIKETKA